MKGGGSRMTPLVRAYIRWAPWRLGKRRLWEGVGAGLARRPRPFVARTRYGFEIAGDQSLIMPRCLYWFGTWEPSLSEWIAARLRPGDVFVDVGASVGYFSLLAARAVGPDGSVVAVEASPAAARRLKENLARNGVSNVRVVEAAAAAEEGRLTFYRAAWNDAESSIVAAGGRTVEGEVPAAPLARLLSEDELARTRVIKVDVEGGELGVLQGLAPVAGLLHRDAQVVVEAHPDMLALQGATVSDLADLLARSGFEARELATDLSELGHLFPPRATAGPLSDSGGLRHLILSRE